MPYPESDDGNGRVTYALLRRDIQSLTEAFGEFAREQRETNKLLAERVASLEVKHHVLNEHVCGNDEDIKEIKNSISTVKNIKGQSIAGDVVALLIAIVAGVLGVKN